MPDKKIWKHYEVTVPITGYICTEVTARSEDEAVSIAIENATMDQIETWSPIRAIVTGNVFHGEMNEAEAVQTED